MTKRRKWATVPGLVAVAATAAILSAYSGASSAEGASPEQPINFPHTVHVGKLGMNCVYCHFAANKSFDPGLPAVGTCIGCHNLIGPERPASDLGPKRTSAELQKLYKFADVKGVGAGMGPGAKPIPWVRIHKVPEYVHFPHVRHVNAGVTCQTCHGQIQNMQRVRQVSSLNMGWCVKCHVNGYSPADGAKAAGYEPTPEQVAAPRKKARYDCAVCHY